MLESTTPEEDIRASIDAAQPVTETTEQVLIRLAALSPLEFDRVCADEAKRLGVKKSTLDSEVKKTRILLTAEENRAVALFPEPETWPEPVEAATLLPELAALFRRYAVLPAHAETALALWVAFTWTIDCFKVAPLLALTSPEKRCGKTTVLSLLTRLTRCSLPTSNISPAALFRAVEKWKPTILIDEADCFLKESDELRGILNSGHTVSTAFVIRNVGDDHEPTRFSTWAAKAIALIGTLPDTLADRSLVVELRRKLAGEKPEKLRHAENGVFDAMQSKLARFSCDHADILRRARPDLLPDISDRAADNWEPLLAIAELAGMEWKAKAVSAARAMSGYETDSPSIGIELLSDIREVFDAKGVERIASTVLIESLCAEEDKPWATFNRGRPLSPRQLSKRLAEYDIHNKPVRIDFKVVKGFELGQFTDAFLRYIPVTPQKSVTELQTASRLDYSVTGAQLHRPSAEETVTPKLALTLACNHVTEKCPPVGGAREVMEVDL